jgi:hypothetical protein
VSLKSSKITLAELTKLWVCYQCWVNWRLTCPPSCRQQRRRRRRAASPSCRAHRTPALLLLFCIVDAVVVANSCVCRVRVAKGLGARPNWETSVSRALFETSCSLPTLLIFTSAVHLCATHDPLAASDGRRSFLSHSFLDSFRSPSRRDMREYGVVILGGSSWMSLRCSNPG